MRAHCVHAALRQVRVRLHVPRVRGVLCSSVTLLSSLRGHSTSSAASAAAALLLRQEGQPQPACEAAPVSTSAQPSASARTAEDSREDDLPLHTPAEVETAFRNSVEARTVSNAQLRRYIHRLQGKDYALGLAAVKGAKAGGLRITSQVYEELLDLLIQGGQLRASMELYQNMLTKERMVPTPRSYALLMDLCTQREMHDACQRLFRDMQKRGMRPSSENYERMLTSLASQSPPKWEEAIQIFDKLTRERKSNVNAKTYNALMKVYMNMQPFDWRVVYNCYHEMRSREPRIPLEWESYLLLKEALRRSKAGRVRRFMAFLDAWVQTTSLWSVDFLKGLLVYFGVMWLIKTVVGYLFMWYVEAAGTARKGSGESAAMIGESMLPVD